MGLTIDPTKEKAPAEKRSSGLQARFILGDEHAFWRDVDAIWAQNLFVICGILSIQFADEINKA